MDHLLFHSLYRKDYIDHSDHHHMPPNHHLKPQTRYTVDHNYHCHENMREPASNSHTVDHC